MFIVMHCGGLPFNGDTIKTQSLGGSETAALYAAKALAEQGHHVTLFTNSQETGIFDNVHYEYAGAQSEDYPLGDRFTFYAENTPHDVCIIQRHPRAFERRLASKINLWWLHDLALLRNKDIVAGQLWNIDKVLCVSEHHRKQVSEVWGIPVDRIAVVNNAVDHALFACEETLPEFERTKAKLNLVYSSRPERGLEHLVREGGIMDRLKDLPIKLHVCGYENTTPQMADYYNYLWQRCELMPNVHFHGALSKSDLAVLQSHCDALVYPTEFEEVSCITAMEAMAAGIGIISSAHGALPETCAGSASILLPLKDGYADEDAFVETIKKRINHIKTTSRATQLKAAEKFTWQNSAAQIIGAVQKTFADAATPAGLAHHFIRHSDIKAFEQLELKPDGSRFTSGLLSEYGAGYRFYRENKYAEHYKAFYQYEADRGINYGAEDVTGTSRFRAVASHVRELPSGSRVLDYGCAHGHYTVMLAKMFPNLEFVGADLSESNIGKATAWAEAEGLSNINFVQVGGVADIANGSKFDLIIAAEVIEHVGNPQEYVDALAKELSDGGRMVITTPYGAWEAQGYRQHNYWRAHLHHFERADLFEMLGHHPNFKILAAPSGMSQFYTPLGSYVVTFTKPTEPSREIDYKRKIAQTMPDQTISCCMIVKDAESDIRRCILSVLPHVQEFVIGVDEMTTDETLAIIQDIARVNPLVPFNVFYIKSPIIQGFDAARNETLSEASCDWVMWIDADEMLVHGESMLRMVRNSMYNGFAVKQHHFSHDPAGIIKTDIPCRLFRNRIGVKFFGKVHEHPEIVMNEGLGGVMLMPRTEIVHHGYHDEGVRRKRFGRNLPLLERDHKENPDRILGKFLWLRDLAQSCQYDMEDGVANEDVLRGRAIEGIKLWEELLDVKNYRLVVDSLPYYSQLAIINGGGFDFSFAVDANKFGKSHAEKQPIISGHFASKAHALRLMTELASDKMVSFDREYQ